MMIILVVDDHDDDLAAIVARENMVPVGRFHQQGDHIESAGFTTPSPGFQ